MSFVVMINLLFKNQKKNPIKINNKSQKLKLLFNNLIIIIKKKKEEVTTRKWFKREE
jgi:hypothetical protein